MKNIFLRLSFALFLAFSTTQLHAQETLTPEQQKELSEFSKHEQMAISTLPKGYQLSKSYRLRLKKDSNTEDAEYQSILSKTSNYVVVLSGNFASNEKINIRIMNEEGKIMAQNTDGKAVLKFTPTVAGIYKVVFNLGTDKEFLVASALGFAKK